MNNVMNKDDLLLGKLLFLFRIEQMKDLKKSRAFPYIFIRQYVYILLKNKGLSLKKIGKIFNKNHATIINSYKMHSNDLEQNTELYLEVINKIDNSDIINFINENY